MGKRKWQRYRLFLFALPVSVVMPLKAAAQNTDSLKKVFNDRGKSDTVRAHIAGRIARAYLYVQPDSSFVYANRELKAARDLHRSDLESEALNTLGVFYLNKSDFNQAISYYLQGLKIEESSGDVRGAAASLNNIGLVYYQTGDLVNALRYQQKGLDAYRRLNEKKGISVSLSNIGNIYLGMLDYFNALNYYQESLKIKEEINYEKGIASTLGNIGSVYLSLPDSDCARLGIEPGEKYARALENFERALEVAKKIGNKQLVANTLGSIGETLAWLKKFKEAIARGMEGLAIAKEIGDLNCEMTIENSLYSTYKKMGDLGEALRHFERSVILKDSIFKENTKEEIAKKEMRYEFEKKAAADSIKVEADKKIVEAKLEKERTFRYALYGGLALLVFFGAIMYNRFKISQRQKAVIEEKNREITDSIHYAQRIQRSLLPSEKYIGRAISKKDDKKT